METPQAPRHSAPRPAVRRRLMMGGAALLVAALSFYGVRIYQYSQGVDLTAYLRTSITPTEQATVLSYLRSLDLIGPVEYLTSEDATRRFVASYRGVPGLSDTAPASVPGSMTVKLARRQVLDAVQAYLPRLPGVDAVVVPEHVRAAPMIAFDPTNRGLVVIFLRPDITPGQRAAIATYLQTLRLRGGITVETMIGAYGRLLHTNPDLAAATSPTVLGEDDQISLADPNDAAAVKAFLTGQPGVARVEAGADLFPHA
jgi:hypothetical protein